MEKANQIIHKIYKILEVCVSILMLLGIVIALIGVVMNYSIFYEIFSNVEAFKHYMEIIFTIVIGIEFLQMLCHPNSNNVLEAIIFLIARHMIVSSTTPLEDFISVVSIVMLCLVRRYLQSTTNKSMLKKKKEETT